MADGLAVAGFVLAIPGLIDLAIKYASFLGDKYELYRSMDKDQRLYKLVLKCTKGSLYDILMYYRENEKLVTPEFRSDLGDLFQTIRDCYESVLFVLGDQANGTWAKVKYSAHGAKKLSKTCDILEAWQERFVTRAIVYRFFGQPLAVMSIIRTKGVITGGAEGSSERSGGEPIPVVDDRAEKGATKRLESMRCTDVGLEVEGGPMKLLLKGYTKENDVSRIGKSQLWIVKKTENDVQKVDDSPPANSSQSLAEYRNYDSSTQQRAQDALRALMRDLAARLRQVDSSTMGILSCLGFSVQQGRFGLHFAYPELSDENKYPRALHGLLTDAQNRRGIMHSLSDRLHLAKQLASAVFYLHAGGFVHKKINPTNIVMFEDASHSFPQSIGNPYLVGFDAVRRVNAASKLVRAEDWEENIYLHPDRHRLQEGDEFTMRHDIYSLGVVLLEIAVWGAFTDKAGVGKYIWKARKINVDGREEIKESLLSAQDLQKQYVTFAKARIPIVLGDTYRDVVVACLEGLEDEEEQQKLRDVDGVIAGLAYVEQIMERLHRIEL